MQGLRKGGAKDVRWELRMVSFVVEQKFGSEVGIGSYNRHNKESDLTLVATAANKKNLLEIPHYWAITGMFKLLGLNKCATTLNSHKFSATNILNDTFPHKTATSPHVLSEEDLQRQKDEGSSREAAKAKAGKPRQDAAWGRKGFFLR